MSIEIILPALAIIIAVAALVVALRMKRGPQGERGERGFPGPQGINGKDGEIVTIGSATVDVVITDDPRKPPVISGNSFFEGGPQGDPQ